MDDSENKVITNTDKYSMKYRYIKTVLMIVAWVSFGFNFELVSTAIEDLKILLGVDYEEFAINLVIRATGYMIVTSFIGLIMDKFLHYSELIMAFAKFLMILPNFLIPWITVYWLSMAMYLTQGIAQAIYDVGGNQIILRLWSGISNSPVNAMHAGFGIGAMGGLYLLKPFIKFDPLDKYRKQTNDTLSSNLTSITSNSTNLTSVTSSDIKLQIPYSIAALIGVVILISFIIAQIFETKNNKKFEKYKNRQIQDEQPLKTKDEQRERGHVGPLAPIQKLLFNHTSYQASQLGVLFLLLFLLFLLFISINIFMNVLNTYMLTYLTLGPAKFSVDYYIYLQTTYWIFFVVGRFLSAYLAFKMDSLKFFFILIILNLIAVSVYAVPYLNSIKMFYWVIVSVLGVTSGPLIPCGFMIAKHIMKEVNAFLVSIFCIGLAIGTLISQYGTGFLFDRFVPSPDWLTYTDATSQYIVPYLLLVSIILCTVFYLLVLLVHKLFSRKIEL